MRGTGFVFYVRQGMRVTRPRGEVVARSGGSAVSVSTFPLRKPYDPAEFGLVAKTLDDVAARLAKAAGAPVATRETVTIASRKGRAYRYGGKRIGFVFAGRREYQLFCTQDDAACDLLFSSFTLTGPQA